MSAEAFLTKLLSGASIQVNGDAPWDVRVVDPRAFDRVLEKGSIGFGESYMDGWFECDRLDDLFYRVYRAELSKKIDKKDAFFEMIKARARSLGSQSKAYDIGKVHYDIGNDLFTRMLDPYMIYSCGYWRRARSLDQAQLDKLELICRKLQLQPGLRVLDIGCGWGGLARYAAENYGVEVVGVTVSQEQLELGRRVCDGLPIELRYQDYRDLDEGFDRIVSVGMFEHVGHRYYRDFFDVANRCLRDDGLFLLHTVGYAQEDVINPWYDKHVMPGVAFPALSQIVRHTEEHFVLEDYHNWRGSHYDQTLMAWFERFDAAWGELEQKYGETFYRMWKLYLQGCAGAFRADRMRVWQLVFAKPSRRTVYDYGEHYSLD